MKALFALLVFIPQLAFADISVPRAKQYLWTQYDTAVSGGSSVPHGLGAILPSGSILTDVWVYINTAFTDSGTGSLGLQCAGSNDLAAYQDITIFAKDSIIGRHRQPTAAGAFNTSFMPQAADSSSVLSFQNGSIPSDCEVTAVVRGDSGYVPLTAGKATIILEYFRQ